MTLFKALYRKKITLEAVADQFNIPLEEIDTEQLGLEQCANCNIWHIPKELKEDLDGNNICTVCEKYYGL